MNLIKRIYRRLLAPFIHLIRKFNARKNLEKLISHESKTIKAIGFALEESLSNKIDSSEENLLKPIEKRRLSLLNMHSKINVVDYGVGASNSKRTKEEMLKGVEAKAKISDICKASKDVFWSRFLFKLIRKLNSSNCIELGTCFGISGSYIASALKINGNGNLHTLEGSIEIANIAHETFKKLNLENISITTGAFSKTFNEVLEKNQTFDFFFNDGHHSYDAVINYFNIVIPFLSKEAIIVIDDISWSKEMKKAWKEIENDLRVCCSIDLGSLGIVMISKNQNKKEMFKIRL